MIGALPDSRVTWALRTDRLSNGKPGPTRYFVDFDEGGTELPIGAHTPKWCRRYASLGVARAWRELELGGRKGRWRIVRLTRLP